MLDVTLVGTRMHRDTVGPQTLAFERKVLHIGTVFATRVAEGGDFVYIYTQVCHKQQLMRIRFLDKCGQPRLRRTSL